MDAMDTTSTPSSEPFSPDNDGSNLPGPAKVDSNGEDPIYKCCGKPFGGKFMIFCEKCEEWLHGECVNIEQAFANNIDKYYCKDCLGQDGSLAIVFTKKYMVKMEKKKKEEEEVKSQRCGKCETCLKALRNEEGCSVCTWCQGSQFDMCVTFRCLQIVAPVKKKAGRPRKDQTLTRSTSDEDGPLSPRSNHEEKDKPKRGRKKGWKKAQIAEKAIKEEAEEANHQKALEVEKKLAQRAYTAATSRSRPKKTNIPQEEPKQCIGIDCVNEARPMSKYCSDACGRALAVERLRRFLPQKVKEYWEHIPSVEVRYHAIAKEKEAQVLRIHAELKHLVDMATMLERYAACLTKAQPSSDEGVPQGPEGIACCSVCGVECSTKQLTAHIQRCFIKSEKQTAFGSTIQENQYGVFCNEYNKASDTYCKRLKIMCPEHYKGELESNMKVCGCPKIWDSIKDKTPSFNEVYVSAEQLLSKRFCLAPRKECTRHMRWLQIALGTLSNERLNLLYKLNEVQEGYLVNTNAQVMHGDVITLLCSGNRGDTETKAEPMET